MRARWGTGTRAGRPFSGCNSNRNEAKNSTIVSEGDVEHQAPTTRSHRGTPTFKSPTVGIARDFGKRAPELDTEGTKEAWLNFRPRITVNGKNYEANKLSDRVTDLSTVQTC